MPAITVEQALQLAMAQAQAGQSAEAATTLRKILAAQPGHPEARRLLNEMLASHERREAPTAVSDWVQLGNALMDGGRLPEAVAAIERALKIEPARPEIHYNLGNAHAKRTDWKQAALCYARALELRPDYPKARSNLGSILLEQNRLEEALAHFERLPEGADRHYNIGVVLSRMGRRDEAADRFQRATALDGGHAEAYWALASELFLRGSYEEGWRLLARHGVLPDRATARVPFDTPKWDGAPTEAGLLLVYEEQGIGDAIQFLRYLPLVQERLAGGRIILECPPALSRLLKQNGRFGGIIVDRGTMLPRHDRRISSLDLPFLLQQWTPVPMREPYLQADSELRRSWRERLGPGSSLRVGLTWAGNPEHRTDRHRSISAEKLLPLLRVPGVTFYTLQVKPNDGSPQPLLRAGLVDLTGAISDFADTAALVAELDLVISVDTAVAHLAGALGQPAWTLLPSAPDWRWGLERDDTPWYPTMRLFRQRSVGNWEEVVARVANALAVLTQRSAHETAREYRTRC